MLTPIFLLPVLLAVTLLSSGCGSLGELGGGTANQAQEIAKNVNGTGTIQSVDIVPRSQGLGLGALAGAAVGGILGSQVGGGRGNTAATVAGAAGGAYVGHEMEKRQRADNKIYKVTIRMDDGTTQAFAKEAEPAIRPGDRVKIVNGVLSRL